MKPHSVHPATWLALASFAALLISPQPALAAAKKGVDLFLTVVAPSLLPFFICSRLLLSGGIVHRISHGLEPVMRPLFGLPGASAFGLCVSLVSGYPSGARTTMDLYANGHLSQNEAATTSLLASTAGPIFMLGAVGAGLLHNPAAGWILLGSHIMAVLVCSISRRILFGFRSHNAEHEDKKQIPASPIAPFGQMLGDAVSSSCATLLSVGGYIVLFSCWSGILQEWQLFSWLAYMLRPLLAATGIPQTLHVSLFNGFLELTTGCSAAASAGQPLQDTLPVMAAMLGWGGMCILYQSLGFLSSIPVRNAYFLRGKAVQALVSYALCRLMLLSPALPAFVTQGSAYSGPIAAWVSSLVYTLIACLALIIVACFGSIRHRPRI